MTYSIKDPDAPATRKQTWAIKCLGGGDVRDQNLTRQQASEMIQKLKAEKGQTDDTPQKENFEDLWQKAKAAGLKAGEEAIPTPMVVSEHENPLDDASAVKQAWYVSEGACGFAWVNFKMKAGLNRRFGQWLIANGHGSKDHYYGGVTIWIGEHNQSITRKEAHARALAIVLLEAGIKDAYSSSRLD